MNNRPHPTQHPLLPGQMIEAAAMPPISSMAIARMSASMPVLRLLDAQPTVTKRLFTHNIENTNKNKKNTVFANAQYANFTKTTHKI